MGKKRKFYGNRFTQAKKAKVDASSLSEEKLGPVKPQPAHQARPAEGFRLVDFTILVDFLQENVVCSSCHGRVKLTKKEFDRQGWASKLVLQCGRCNRRRETMTSKTMRDKGYEVNRRGVLGMRTVGCGHAAMEQFSSLMNMGCITVKSYNVHVKKLRENAMMESRKSMQRAMTGA